MPCRYANESVLYLSCEVSSILYIFILMIGLLNMNSLKQNPSLILILDMDMYSNRQGLNARGLLETITTGKYSTAVESSGDSFRELVDSKKSGSTHSSEDYMKTLQSLIGRFKYVEQHGYTSPDEKVLDAKVETTKAEKVPQKKKSAESPPSKAKKKKKKKDNPTAVASKIVSSAQAQSRPKIDPLVSALLSMGFSNEQIDAAVLAFGGTDRVTADDMVVWILERESNGGVSSETSQEVEARDTGNSSNYEQQMLDAEVIQRRAEQEAKREQEEALKKIADAKAASERLAAKREEQRRIRREWNNREQLRQQEEAQAKLAEEVQRRRRIEAEKAKAKAQRVAEERAAPSVLAQAMGMPSVPHGLSNAGSVPLFSTGMSNSVSDTQSVSSTQTMDQPKRAPPPGVPPGISVGDSSVASSGSKSPKSQVKNRKKRSGKTQKNSLSPKPNRKTPLNPPKQHFVNEQTNFPVRYDENPLGEIRATAREFVPSYVSTSTLPAAQVQPKPMPQSAPPGLGLPSDMDNAVTNSLGSLSALSSDQTSSILPSLEATGQMKPFPFVPSIGMDRALSAPGNLPSDISTASLSGGLSMPSNKFIPGVLGSNSSKHEDELVSSILNTSLSLDGQASHDPLSSLGALDSSSGAGNIWSGTAGASVASGNLGALPAFGFASQNDNATSSFSPNDSNPTNASSNDKKDITNNTWGSFGPSTGGSIW